MKNFTWRTAILIASLLLLSIPAFAANPTSSFNNGYLGNTSTTALQYVAPDAGSGWSATEANVWHLATGGFTIIGLKVQSRVDPGSGATWDVALSKNGSVVSTPTCEIGHNSGLPPWRCSDTTDTVHIAQGDTYDLRQCPSNATGCPAGTAPVASQISTEIVYIPDNIGETFLGGNDSTNLSTPTSYLAFMGSGFVSTAEPDRYMVNSISGTATVLCTNLSGAPGATKTRTFTLRQNGFDTGLLTTYGAAVTGQLCSTGSITVSPGDTLSLESSQTGGAGGGAGLYFGLTIVATNPGEFNIPSNAATGLLSATALRYMPLGAFDSTVGALPSASENFRLFGNADYNITGLYVQLATAPGAGSSYTFDTHNNGISAGGVSAGSLGIYPTSTVTGKPMFEVTISGTNTQGNNTSDSSIPITGELLDAAICPSNLAGCPAGVAPAASKVAFTYRGNSVFTIPSPCSPNLIIDFSAGTSGQPVTLQTAISGAFGQNAPLATLVGAGTSLTYSTTAYHAYGGSLQTKCRRPWPGDTGGLGLVSKADGTNAFHNVLYTLPLTWNGITRGTATTLGAWFKTDYLGTDSLDADVFTLRDFSVNNIFVNAPLQNNSGNLNFNMELSTPCLGTPTGGPINIGPNVTPRWVWIALLLSNTLKIGVFSEAGLQLGEIDATCAVTGNVADSVYLGFSASSVGTLNKNFYYSGATVDYAGTWPFPPPMSSSGNSNLTTLGAGDDHRNHYWKDWLN